MWLSIVEETVAQRRRYMASFEGHKNNLLRGGLMASAARVRLEDDVDDGSTGIREQRTLFLTATMILSL